MPPFSLVHGGPTTCGMHMGFSAFPSPLMPDVVEGFGGGCDDLCGTACMRRGLGDRCCLVPSGVHSCGLQLVLAGVWTRGTQGVVRAGSAV